VRTANSCGKFAQIISEMKRYRLKIFGISEMRWPSSEKFISEDTTVLFSGGEKHEKGVGLLFDKLSAKAIVSWEPVSDRIITARLKTRFTNVTVMQIYAPTETSCEKDKDDFYDQLNAVVDA